MSAKHAIKALLQHCLGYPRYLRLFSRFKIRTLRFDWRERDFFRFLSLLPTDGTVLDIGANLGFLTYYMSRRAVSGRVIAFEPMPDNLAVLRYVVQRYGLRNVQIEGCALGDSNSTATMILPRSSAALEQGLCHVVGEDTKEGGMLFRVPMQTLDALRDRFEGGLRVVGIKMDVENFEQYVLKGGERVIREQRPVIYIELMNNENRRRCFEMAASWDYRVLVGEKAGLVEFDATRHASRINMFLLAR